MTRSARSSLAMLALCLGVTAGCVSNAPTPIAKRQSASPVDYADYAKLGYRLDWRGFPSLTGRNSSVDFIKPLGEVVAALESGSRLTLIEDTNGANRSTPGLASSFTTFLGLDVVGDDVIAMSDTSLYFIDRNTGIVSDRQDFAKLGNSAPLVIGDVVVYGTGDGHVVGHLTGPGVPLWGSSVNGPIDYQPIAARTTGGTYALICSRAGELLILEPRRGGLVGRARMFAGPGNQPAAGDGMFFVPSLDQSLYAIDARNAQQRWRIRTENQVLGAPAYHSGRVYCELPGDGMTAIDASTGSTRWNNAEVTGDVIGVRAGRVLVWDEDTRTATTLDASTGGIRDRVELPSISTMFCEPFEDGSLYTVSEANVVAKFLPDA